MQKMIDATREAVREVDIVRARVCDIRHACALMPEGIQKSLKDAYDAATEAQYRLLDAVTSMETAGDDPP